MRKKWFAWSITQSNYYIWETGLQSLPPGIESKEKNGEKDLKNSEQSGSFDEF